MKQMKAAKVLGPENFNYEFVKFRKVVNIQNMQYPSIMKIARSTSKNVINFYKALH